MDVSVMFPDKHLRKTEMLFVSFNQDFGCFACGTDTGFRIFNVDPFKETFRRVFNGGGIGIVEMLFRCNLLAIVGGGRSPRYPPNKVMVWDDHQNRCIGELSFRSDVRAVKLRRDRVVVVLATKVYVYRFSDLKLLDQINTQPNPRGLVALCPTPQHNVLACPGVNRGHARVELYDARKSTVITAHESDLARLALSTDGALVATASDKGTLIRVFDSHSGAQLRELRRGVDRATVYSIVFDPEAKYLACSSDKGTVHVFSLNADGSRALRPGAPRPNDRQPSGDAAPANTKSNLSFLRKVVPGLASAYLESEWSFAQVRGLDAPTICAFGAQPNTIISVGADGSFLVSRFAEGGECERIAYHKFIKSKEDEDFDKPPWEDPSTGMTPPPGHAAAHDRPSALPKVEPSGPLPEIPPEPRALVPPPAPSAKPAEAADEARTPARDEEPPPPPEFGAESIYHETMTGDDS